ncbi:hypothetical protein cypCar_00017685 [Cyprinus carpio]|nr:hypothetical protein cypCar_00017685 [Cyprinus carpio]
MITGGLESGIVGGKEVKPHSRPYMASLQYRRQHKCGGMLISDDYVLTSAHCLDKTTSFLEVVLGAHNISQNEDSQQIIQVDKYIKHPKYENEGLTYDIMLLKMKTKAVRNEFVDVIELPKNKEDIPAHVECSIAGWGKKKPGGRASDVLWEVSLKLQFSFECKNKWKHHFNSEKMICSVSDGKRAFCQGDSGSPLFCDSELKGMAAYTYPNDCGMDSFQAITWHLQINKHHTCGGMLIRDYVLGPLFETKLHSLQFFNFFHSRSVFSSRDHFEVVLGAHDITKKEQSQQRIPVRKYIRHPMFERNKAVDYSYDIMLLKLKNKAKLSKFVKVMPFPKKNGKTPANVHCSIAGWGAKTPEGNQASDVMREVSLKLQFSTECKNKWQQYFNSERMICSISDGKHAFCMGDSGSPLICNTKPQGIASYTFTGNCTNKSYPQVYVKTSYFLPWIKKNIG